ncbi:MAG: hypothetical protein NZM38_08575 [Cytophagales bacterium]|nr:hypothetical protein [Cytophagales bacterium]MDW8384813.1 hypothetical protein [Flammeovirgaceae bacterium]
MKNLWELGLLGGFALMVGCIPIQDAVNPRLFPRLETRNSRFLPDTVYEYFDTIQFEVEIADNSALDSAVLYVRKRAGEIITPQDWNYQQILIPYWDSASNTQIRGMRMFKRPVSITVPNRITPGNYQFVLESYDFAKNGDQIASPFRLVPDITPPVLENFSFNLPRLPDGRYVVCRNTRFDFTGRAYDKNKIIRVGYALIENQENLLAVKADTFDFGSKFSNKILIPSSSFDNQEFNLTFVAVDTFENVARQSFRLVVICDDLPPVVSITRTVPQMNQLRQILLLSKETSFSVLDAEVRDNKGISRIGMSIRKGNQILSPQFYKTFSGRDTLIRIADHLDSLRTVFNLQTFDPLARVGDEYELMIFATDISGLTNDPFIIKVTLKEDELPTIEMFDPTLPHIQNFRRDNLASTNDTTVYTASINMNCFNTSSIRLGVNGKIEDDLGIRQIRFEWTRNRNGNTQVIIPEFTVNYTGILPVFRSFADPDLNFTEGGIITDPNIRLTFGERPQNFFQLNDILELKMRVIDSRTDNTNNAKFLRYTLVVVQQPGC